MNNKLKMSNKLNLILAIVFVLFGIVQYNDPDWYIWMPAYFLVALLYFKPSIIKNKSMVFLPIIGFGLWAASYVPAFLEWVKNGTPTITGTMKAENPEVELMREFFGLIICMVGLIHIKSQIKTIN